MIKSYKYRIYPTKDQSELLNKHFGCCRYIYNWGLGKCIEHYKETKETLGAYDIIRQITQLKKQPETEWLKEVAIMPLQQEVLHMESAYRKFFKDKKGFPKFKSKHKSRLSYSLPTGIKIKNGKIQIPKVGLLKVRPLPEIEGLIKSGTVSKSPTGKYYISILVETLIDKVPKKAPEESNSIGIDLGIKYFAVTSDGEVIDNPKYLRNDIQRLKILQKRASRKQIGSANRRKANLRVALRHEKISNKRNDFLHKLSMRLITENQSGTICLENLNVSGMLKNHKLAQSISDVSWSNFNTMLEYKADWYGVNILRIGRFDPSSKMCSCGMINKDLKLSDREWTCNSCGCTHNRDELAAQNIKKFTFHPLKKSGAGSPVEPVEMSAVVESVKQEYCLIIKT